MIKNNQDSNGGHSRISFTQRKASFQVQGNETAVLVHNHYEAGDATSNLFKVEHVLEIVHYFFNSKYQGAILFVSSKSTAFFLDT